jgi:hypothetical protein
LDDPIVDENAEEPDTSVVAAAVDLEEAETSLDTGFEEASLFNTPRIEGVPITSASDEKVILHIIKASLVHDLRVTSSLPNFLDKILIKCQKYPSVHI